jgi:hypothetical protein
VSSRRFQSVCASMKLILRDMGVYAGIIEALWKLGETGAMARGVCQTAALIFCSSSRPGMFWQSVIEDAKPKHDGKAFILELGVLSSHRPTIVPV